MNIREKVIIKNLLSENASLCNSQLQQLFYSDLKDCSEDIKDIRGAIQKTIRYFFSDSIYFGKFCEVYDVVVSLLFISIKKAGASVFDNVQTTLKKYLNTMTHNICANPKSRKEINISIGVNPYDDPFGFINDKDDDRDTDEPLEPETDGYAEGILDYYISLIPSKSYRDLLRALDIEGIKNKDYAFMHGLSVNAVNIQHKRAKLELTIAVLPVIREDCRDIFEKHKVDIATTEASLLTRFFSGERELDSEKIAQAMRKLIKLYNKELHRKQKERHERYVKYQAEKKESEKNSDSNELTTKNNPKKYE